MSNDVSSGFKKFVQEDGKMKTIIVTGLAELVGTTILICIGCMSCVGGMGMLPPHLQTTLSFGLTVMIVIQCFGHISDAHVNPAVTIGSVVLGKKTIPEALVYIVAQTIGAVLGYGILKVVTPRDNQTTGYPGGENMLCVTDIHPDLSAMQGLLMEMLATGILILVVCAVWDRRNEKNTDSVPIKFGFTVAALATVVGPYTGCSMNPVRTLGPAVWNNYWAHHWIYWFGPIGGALVSSYSYRIVFGVKDDVEEETVPESVALNSVTTQKPE